MRQLFLTSLAAGPIILGVLAHDATGGSTVVGWLVFLGTLTLAGFVLKSTALDR